MSTLAVAVRLEVKVRVRVERKVEHARSGREAGS